MRLLVSGYRHFNHEPTIEREMLEILNITPNERHVIIHGNCSGVDKTADRIARKHGWDVDIYNPNWSIGKKAGPIRNREMLENGKPEQCLLFLHPNSKGTKDMKNAIEEVGLPYTIIHIE
jgi:hypothetical protein